jgi:hypothetical protein
MMRDEREEEREEKEKREGKRYVYVRVRFVEMRKFFFLRAKTVIFSCKVPVPYE